MKRAMVTIAKDLSSRIALNDGIQMPMFGLGMYQSSSGKGGEAEKCVKHAISHGYRLIDTAEMYDNEDGVGYGIASSNEARENIFVVTKLWTNGYNRCKKTLNASLQNLGLKYVDLYLIHSPMGGKCVETYKAMLELKEQGLIRSVGVSNFGVQHLEGLKAANLPTPSVNQIELHPWQQKRDIVKYCRENNIAVMGYSPLTKGEKLSDPMLVKMAQKYNKSPAQIMIRWSIEQGFITIPKTAILKRIPENADVFNFSLEEDDLSKLNSLPDWSCTWNPCKSPWKG